MHKTNRKNGFHVWVNSTANKQEYPGNESTAFTNVLGKPIVDGDEYEVGLVNVLFPKNIYAIKKFDESWSIMFLTQYYTGSHLTTSESVRYYPNYNIKASTLEIFIDRYAEDVTKFLINQKFIRGTLKGNNIFDYQRLRKVITFNRLIPYNQFANDDSVTFVTKLKFMKKSAKLFGFHPGEYFEIDDVMKSMGRPKLDPLDFGMDVLSNIYIYTDIVTPSLVGNTEAGILDVVGVDSGSYKQNNYTIYHKLSKKNIESISMMFLQDTGAKVPFIEGAASTVCLHFRPIE